ncbi:MAG: tyrosine-type recombinase/integrase [Plesiomonas sp.]
MNSDNVERKMLSTDLEIAALKPPVGVKVKRYAVKSKHGGGLKAEIRESGLIRFLYRYKINGKEYELLLGTYPAFRLAKIREKHGEAVALVKQGINPLLQAKQAKIINATALTLSMLFERWFQAQEVAAEVKPTTLKKHRWRWEHYLLDMLGNIRLLDFERAHLSHALEQVRAKSKEETRKALGTLVAMLDYAVTHGFVETNIARLVRPKDYSASASSPRERWLTVPELRLLWKALDEDLAAGSCVKDSKTGLFVQGAISASVCNIIKMVILTGCRRGEIVDMRFSNIDGDTLVLPETKNGKSHTIFLSPMAMRLINQQRLLTEGDVVFPSERLRESKGDVPVTADSVTKALRHLRERRLPDMAAFTVHDLRRSAASNWAERLGTEERIIERCLNHLPQNKLVRTYHRAKHDDEMKDTWMRWGDLVASEIASEPRPDGELVSDNVISVQFGRR